jgi:hypothetical protein
MHALAARFEIKPELVKECLVSAGITLRSYSEQCSIEFKMGRRKVPENVLVLAKSRKPIRTAEGIEKSRAWAKNHLNKLGCAAYCRKSEDARVYLPCYWCGEVLSTTPYRAAAYERRYCCKAHSCKGMQHVKRRPDTPRPLIVARLRELNKGWPNTFERLEKVGQQIGAREPEILEVLAQDLDR